MHRIIACMLPGLLVLENTIASAEGFSRYFVGFAVLLSFLGLVVGELLERYLFFTAVVTPKMPGSPTS